MPTAQTRGRDHETTRPRDHETTRLRDLKEAGNARNIPSSRSPEVPRKTQSFSVVLSRSQLYAAVRGSLVSEWCRCGASQKRVPRDSTKTYSPWYFTFWDVPQMRRYHTKLSHQAIRSSPSALPPHPPEPPSSPPCRSQRATL